MEADRTMILHHEGKVAKHPIRSGFAMFSPRVYAASGFRAEDGDIPWRRALNGVICLVRSGFAQGTSWLATISAFLGSTWLV